ncbi:MAG: flavodoxin [Dehalococcoidia bacterium]|nr:flavodoxin [Dehalococcoidia bacterium]
MEDLRVLIACSSVHGSTAEIARSIALTLRRTGIDAEVGSANEVRDLDGYAAVVLGSAVYGGRWRGDAVGFLERFGLELFKRDVWLFQSGPLGLSAQGIVRTLPVNVGVHAGYLRVRGFATFGGKLDGDSGGPVARFLARAGFAGDYRDFNEIRLWAEDIARVIARDRVIGRGAPSLVGRCVRR